MERYVTLLNESELQINVDHSLQSPTEFTRLVSSHLVNVMCIHGVHSVQIDLCVQYHARCSQAGVARLSIP